MMMDPQRFAQLFPLGSHLYHQPMPPLDELKRDMGNLKEHGFNLIELGEPWAAIEPLEGSCDFSRYAELIEHAAALDLAVTVASVCDQAPAWLWRKYPDATRRAPNGLPLGLAGEAAPCQDHPGVAAGQLRFIRGLVAALGRYENVVAWNMSGDAGCRADDSGRPGACYCEHSLEAFRTWLRGRYVDLEALNRAWDTRYPDWGAVSPAGPRHPQPQDLDWNYFIANVQVTQVLRARAAAVKEADPLGRPVFASVSSPRLASGRDWLYARCQDFLSTACYPAQRTFHPWDDGHPIAGQPIDRHAAAFLELWDGLALQCDYLRSCNPRGGSVWLTELQGGPISEDFHKGRVPTPADIRHWMLTATACGVSGIAFGPARAELAMGHAGGYGLLDSAGDMTPRYQEAARVGAALNAQAALFGAPSRPWAKVGILVDEWNYQAAELLGSGALHLPYSLRGWYRLLWDLNIPVDFVATSDLGEPFIANYKALVMPFPLSFSEQTAALLTGYVEHGGNLISEAAPGRLDEHGRGHRGEMSPAMAALFGVRQLDFGMTHEPGNETRWSPPERTWGEYAETAVLEGAGPLAGHHLRVQVYLQTFECVDGQPLLYLQLASQQRLVAGAVRQTGQGRAWLLGTYLGHSGTAYRSEAAHGTALALLAACGVEPEHRGRLLLRKRVTEGKEAWFFINPGRPPATDELDVSGFARVEDLLGEPMKYAGRRISLTVQGLEARVLILTRE
jgi:beta-galactosidase